MKAWTLPAAWACACTTALAQVPETGRWQNLDFPEVEVHVRSADRYWDRLIALSEQGLLDDDRAVLARVRRVSDTLIAAAARMRPETTDWDWEIHTTSAPEVDAYCMAGGKLMVGSRFVRRLALDDAELATLIAHEVAHALAEHHRETLSSVLHVSPLPANSVETTMERLASDFTLQLRLSTLSSIQEREADQLGMILAHRAGWPADGMVNFYRKLAADERQSVLASSHPAASSRLSMARGMRELFHSQPGRR